MREQLQLELAGSYWQVLLAGLVAILSLPIAPLPRGSSSSIGKSI